MIDDENIAFVAKGQPGKKIGYHCIVENITEDNENYWKYKIYDFDKDTELYDELSTFNTTSFEMKIPKENNLIKIGETDYYGYITIESEQELYLSNIICDDFPLSFNQEKTSTIISGKKKYYNKFKINFLSIDDMPNQTINFSFIIDICKGNNNIKKIKNHNFNVSLYYESETPQGD